MQKIKIVLTLFVAALLVFGILPQLSVCYANRAAEPAMRLLQSEAPRGDGEGLDSCCSVRITSGYLKTAISVFQVAFVHYNFNTHLR